MRKADKLAISRLHFPITALGYGNRIGLWTQGCSIHCKGCMSVDTWPNAESGARIQDILVRLAPWLNQADGITVSGGEPFDQPEGIVTFLATVRQRVKGDILLFSGYQFDEIPGAAIPAFNYLDALVCGPFIPERASALPLLSSDNQELRLLSPLGKARYQNLDTNSSPRIDIIETDGELWLAGIPRPGDLDRLHSILSEQRLSLKTSAGRLGELG